MTRTPFLIMTAALVALQASAAAAQERNPLMSFRQQEARQETRQGRRLEVGDIVRRVSSGRPGRMLGVQPRGDYYVVRWEYPGGRVADISVDARTGDIVGGG